MESCLVDAKCTSVKLDGNWSGSMYDEVCELNITQIGEDGTIDGTFTYYSGTHSYYVSGKIDLKTLAIYLQTGDVIKAEYDFWGEVRYPKDIIRAVLNVDDSRIYGKVDDISFEVVQ